MVIWCTGGLLGQTFLIHGLVACWIWPITFGESYILSDTFIKDLFTRLEKEMETISFSGSAIDHHTPVKEAKGGHELGRSTMMGNANENGNKLGHEKVSGKKKGKSAANAKSSAAEVSLDNQDSAPTK